MILFDCSPHSYMNHNKSLMCPKVDSPLLKVNAGSPLLRITVGGFTN